MYIKLGGPIGPPWGPQVLYTQLIFYISKKVLYIIVFSFIFSVKKTQKKPNRPYWCPYRPWGPIGPPWGPRGPQVLYTQLIFYIFNKKKKLKIHSFSFRFSIKKFLMNRNRYELEPGFKDLGLNRTEPNRGFAVDLRNWNWPPCLS